MVTNLLANMTVLVLGGTIPTNTPAFQEYARKVMFTNSQTIVTKWHIAERVFTTNNITGFWATPYPEGVNNHIGKSKQIGVKSQHSTNGPGFPRLASHADVIDLRWSRINKGFHLY
jgi:hypothetical protein